MFPFINLIYLCKQTCHHSISSYAWILQVSVCFVNKSPHTSNISSVNLSCTDCTFEMCAPNSWWILAQLKQMNTPRFTETHLGSVGRWEEGEKEEARGKTGGRREGESQNILPAH